MTDDLRDLYQDVVLDHGRKPRNHRVMDDATATAEGHNPLCGDEIKLFLKTEGGVIRDLSFQGSGCAISRASASLMTAALKNKTVEEADEVYRRFHAMLTAGPADKPSTEGLGKLAALSGVHEFPARVKCAALAWHTLRSALHGDTPGSTE
jgi:nitrogen fixation NifU-like protein